MTKTPFCNCDDCKCDPCTCGKGNNCCTGSRFWFWAMIRIAIVVLLILGAFALGARIGAGHGYGKMSDNRYHSRRDMMMQDRMKGGADSMMEHCKTMPEMMGCKKYKTTTQTGMSHDMMSMSMSDMGAMLEGKTGDALDRAFLEGMIPHHQGAVDMAAYLVNAKHPELRQMGLDIISAQKKEIEQMNKWLVEWGYANTGSTNTGMMNMSMSGMMMR